MTKTITPINLSPKQIWSINRAEKRINLWVGAVRSSKTWATLFRWVKYICEAPPGDLLVIGKTSRTVYRNIIRPLEDFLGSAVSFSYGKGELDILGKKCFVIGANDERSEGIIRGMTCAGALGDEVTLWPESVFKMLLSRMSVDGAKMFGTTNTDNPNHYLKKDFIDRRHELNMIVFRFMIEDNPYLSREFVNSLKKEYTGIWYRRFIEALWCIAEGAVYDFFEEKLPYVIKIIPHAKYKVLGIDYGTGNPTTFGLYGVNHFTKPKIWLEREYYYDSRRMKRQKSDSEYADDLIDFVDKDKPLYTIIDPSAASFKVELRNRRNFSSMILDANNDVIDGIRTVTKMWKSGDYAIHESCVSSIEETYSYVWDPRSQQRGIDAPKKENDHTKDRDRYVLHTLYGEDVIDYEKLTQF